MQAKVALGSAGVAAILAIGIVSLDLTFSLTSRIDRLNSDGAWETVSESDSEHYRYAKAIPFDSCWGTEFRLVVDNHKPLPERVNILIQYHNASSAREQLVLETRWSLKQFEIREHVFQIPAEAFNGTDTHMSPGESPRPVNDLMVSASVDSFYLSACAGRPE